MIYIGSDHIGYELKQVIKELVESLGDTKVIDLGVFAIEEQADYPDIAREVAEKIAENGESAGAKGILIDKSGIGMMMAANQVPGVRASVATNKEMAVLARSCNDANIVCIGSEIMEQEVAKEIVQAFLTTEFSEEEGDKRCVDKLNR